MKLIKRKIPNIIRETGSIHFGKLIIAFCFLPLFYCNQAKYYNQCDPSSEIFKKVLQIKIFAPDSIPYCGIPGFKKNTSSISAIAPTNISYSQTQFAFTQGTTISPAIPTIGGSITECAATPFLPAGLSLENTSCILSGNPTVGTPLTDYKITASNSAGSVSTTISIRTIFGSAKFAYVPNFTTNNISIFSIDQSTGALSSISTASLGSSGRDIVIDFSGKYLYVLAYGTSMVQTFSINNITGALTAIGTPVSTGTNPNSVTMHPTGKFLYVTSAGGMVNSFTVDQTTGLLTSSGSLPTGATSRWIRIDPTGKYAFTVNGASNDLYSYSIDQSTGILSQIGSPLAIGTDPRSLSITPDGKYIFTAEFNANKLTAYSLNQTTGVVTNTGNFAPISSAPESVFVHPTGKYVYVAFTAGGPIGSISGYTINTNTGGITLINTATNGAISPNRIVIDPTGKFVYSSSYNSNNITLSTIDPTTGIITNVTSYAAGTNPNGIFITGVNPK